MGFSRATGPPPAPTHLTNALVGIGFGLASRGDRNPNIEDTLLHASREAMNGDDLRLLAILATWFGVHHARINASRMIRLVQTDPSPRVRALWHGFATWQASDRRFAPLAASAGPAIDLLAVGTAFHLRRSGEDLRFAGSALRVPAGVLRDRNDDVLTPAELVARHDTYRWRVIIGPNYRADLWATLETRRDLSVAQLARVTYASFSSAWHAKRDFDLLAQNPPG